MNELLGAPAAAAWRDYGDHLARVEAEGRLRGEFRLLRTLSK